jgi:7-carboxy-7-deazaguanine synthase
MQSKTSDSAHWASADANQLVEHLVDDTYSAKHIVITGGEPCLFDLKPISRALIDAGCSVQVETSGTFEMSIDHRAWVTLSPKVDMPGGLKVLDSSLHRANEIKHPVARLSHVSQLQALLEKLNKNSLPVIYLQPISQQQRATELAMKSCIENNWRLSLQTHKFIGIE